MHRIKFALLVVLFVALTAQDGCGPEPFDCTTVEPEKIDEVLTVRRPVSGRYIVTLRTGGVSVRAAGLTTQSMESLATTYGASDVRAFSTTGQFAARVDDQQVDRLVQDPQVLFVEQDGRRSVRPLAGEDVGSWGLDRIDQRLRPLDGVFEPEGTGTGVHVYVIDTGIDVDHNDFEGRIGESHNVYGGDMVDDHGHGTHVAGTVGSLTYGVAKEVIIHAVRVLKGGSGADSDVIRGIDWVTQHAETNGWPAVANMSLGGDSSKSLDIATCRSIEAGVVHVVAAGNDRTNACGVSPARVVQAITVGAVAESKKDRTAYFSNVGKCVDIWAPGEDIKSTWRGDATNVLSGTSMASPHVAGVAALALERHPGLDPAETTEKLLAMATPDVVKGEKDALMLYAKED